MKYWWALVVRDYFTFSKRERNGIVISVVLVTIAAIVLTRFFHPPKQTINQQAFINEIAQLKISIDSTGRNRFTPNRADDNFDYYQPKRNSFTDELKGELFVFDPNTLSAEGWKKLGVKDKTIQTIQNFLQKGYTFKQPADIGKIYGMRPGQVKRLLPYVHIEEKKASNNYVKNAAFTSSASLATEKRAASIVEINLADTAAFIMLPGIGSKLSARIVNFRNKLGGFVTVDQVAETYGLPDSTFQKIRNRLRCDQSAIQTININLADANQLKAHPYISWNVATVIVRYREQHGNYDTVSDLLKIEIINQEMFKKMGPYLSVQ